MSPSKKAGFTIIESMLFLAISGLLVMGILVGTGASINVQRYRDSVTSLQSVLQQQYSEVANVNNGRDANWSCVDGQIVQKSPGAGIERGQSDCVILGRLIKTIDNKVLSIKDVVGSIPSSYSPGASDVKALGDYRIKVSPILDESYEIEWGSSLVQPGGNIAAAFSILVIRSPSSGVVRTFISPTESVADRDVAKLITEDTLSQSVEMCVDAGSPFTGGRMAVAVMANATSASGVETLGETMNEC